MAETIEQWYTILQETCDKWETEVKRLESENTDGSLTDGSLTDGSLTDGSFTKQINQILPTLEKYRYYLDKKPTTTTSTTTSTEQGCPDLITFD